MLRDLISYYFFPSSPNQSLANSFHGKQNEINIFASCATLFDAMLSNKTLLNTNKKCQSCVSFHENRNNNWASNRNHWAINFSLRWFHMEQRSFCRHRGNHFSAKINFVAKCEFCQYNKGKQTKNRCRFGLGHRYHSKNSVNGFFCVSKIQKCHPLPNSIKMFCLSECHDIDTSHFVCEHYIQCSVLNVRHSLSKDPI